MEIDSGLAHLPDLPQAVGSDSMSGETRCRIEKRKRAGSRLRSFLLPSMTARVGAASLLFNSGGYGDEAAEAQSFQPF